MPQEQISFVKGLNAVANPESLADGEVALATNIDFSAQTGAAMARRGSQHFSSTPIGSGGSPQWIWRIINQNLTRDSSPYYIWRGNQVSMVTLGTVTTSNVVATGSGFPAATSYQGTAFISYGDSNTTYYVTTGGTAKEWITQAPQGVLNFSTATGSNIINGIQSIAPFKYTPTWGTFTIYTSTSSAVGTAVGSGTKEYLVDPALTSLGAVAMTTAICTAILSGTQTNMSTDSNGLAVGSNGLSTLITRCDNPANSGFVGALQEYSIGDTSFNNTWSASSYNSGFNPVWGVAYNASSTGTEPIWIVPRSAFTYTGTGTPDYSWSNIQAVRVTMISYGTAVWDMYLGAISGYDPSLYPLNQSGGTSTNTASNTYAWYETYAQGTTTTIGTATYTLLSVESTPSPPLTAILSVNAGRAFITSTNTATGSKHTFNYRALYRQGGSLGLPYRVGIYPYATTTYTDTESDYNAVLDGFILQTNLASRQSLAGTNITCASEPYMSRLFFAEGNQILWSNPGQPQMIPNTNYAVVSSPGDQVQALQQYMPQMVIVNQDSIYEIQGQYFEGTAADYTIYRTGSRRGSKAQFTAIKTPYGIPILDYDGLYFYQPGGGVEQPLPWITERIGDMFRGTAANDPAAIQGRIPAVNLSAISSSWAAFATNKLYLALPCGAAAIPSHMLVIDFTYQRVWLYNYPTNYSAGMYDVIGNRLLAIDTNGYLNRLEYGISDVSGTGTQPVSWVVQTKRWQWPDSSRLIHLHPQIVGDCTAQLRYEDYTSVSGLLSLGSNTFIGTAWPSYALNGILANSAEFIFNGTVAATSTYQEGIKEVYWDIMPEGQTVNYYRSTTFHHPTIYQSQYFGASAQENEWQLCNLELRVPGVTGTCTVTGTIYIDGSAVTTATMSGNAHTQIPYVWSISLPPKTFGRNGWMEVRSTGGRFCAINQWFMTQPSPETFTTRRTQPEVWDGEQEVRDVQAIIDPLGGTASGTVFLDNVNFGTFTATGSEQSPVVFSLPEFTYANSGYVIYNAQQTGTGTQYMKEWKTWFEKTKEPARVTTWRTETKEYPNGQIFQTWLAVLNPLGGTVTGTLVMDGTSINTATFTGTRQLNYETGVDFTMVPFAPNVKANTVWVDYNSVTGTPFKHYATEYIVEPSPNQKTSWMINYGKLGGASQIDMARWWDLDIEVSGVSTAIVTSIWDTDFGTAQCTNTIVVQPGRQWFDRISFPPGIRGRLFQQRMECSVPCQVWSSNLDLIPMMIKGATRRAISKIPGVPK